MNPGLQKQEQLTLDRSLDAEADRDRLQRLSEYNIIGTDPEREFDDIARLAADALGAPVALISIAEAERHWFKARIGTEIREVPRALSFCDYAMNQEDVFVVLDASADERFVHYPLVVDDPKMRFYIGANLLAPDGHKLGTLCVADVRTRDQVSDRQVDAVRILARIASDRLELRRHQIQLTEEQAKSNAAEREARFTHERLRDAIEMLPEAIVFMDSEDRYILWNRAYTELYTEIADLLAPGVSFEYILRMSIEEGDHPEAVDDPEQWLAWRMEQHRKPSGIIEQKFRDGRWMRHEQRKTTDGGTIGVRVDITDLKTREENFRLLFDGNPVPMWVYEQETLRFLAVNDAAVRHYGHERKRFLEMSLPELHSDADRVDCVEVAFGRQPCDQKRIWNHLISDRSAIKVMPFTQALRFLNRPAVLSAIVDVTERIEAEERVQFLAHHDVLTGLANRSQFDERLQTLVLKAGKGDFDLAVCLLDIDHFKEINDTNGHSGGDVVLKTVADHLAGSVRLSDMVARLGGDEFGILLVGLGDEAELRRIATRLLDLGSIRTKSRGSSFAVAASLGIAKFPDDGRDPQTLIQNADLALYKSKVDGRGRHTIFNGEMRRHNDERIHLARRFRQALGRGELVPYYQPIVDLQRGNVQGFEALVRWRVKDKGLLAAGEFSSVFEDHELAGALGDFMLQAVTDDMRKWREAGIAYNFVGLNMTAADLVSERFAARVLDTLTTKGLSPQCLIIETTENVVIGSPGDKVISTLNELAAQGIVVALDDFGTGYASLAHLKKIDVGILKIDQSFVRGLGSDPEDAAIVNAVIGLGINLGIKTIAEGVETPGQATLLRAAGCDFGQGYLYGKPSSAERLPFVVRALGKGSQTSRSASGHGRNVA